MRCLMIATMLLPGLAMAADWEPLRRDDAIRKALSDRTLRYDAYTTQYFSKAGETVYYTERAASGRWDARGGQYCSTWPPSDTWACYDIEVMEDRVRFIASDRSQSEGWTAE